MMGGPKFWRDRAAEARRLAGRTLDPRSKSILSKLAEGYEELARVITRANGSEKVSAKRAKQTARDREDPLSLARGPEATLAQEPETQSLADSVPSQSGSTRRTTYWVGDKPVSLVYIPALAYEHPETTTRGPPHR